jgi:polysaccharide deacetylase 2 family uncharacterized protein YibQ
MVKKKPQDKLAYAALTLAIVFIAAIAFYRYLKTDPGKIFLVDVGVSSAYESVQAETERRVVRVLRRHGVLSKQIRISDDEEPGAGRARLIRAEAPPDASLVQINVALDRSVRAVGGKVHSCREGRDGSIITMEIGTKRAVTHRCVIKKGSERQHYARAAVKRSPVVAVCIDDFGFFNNALVRELLELDFPLTISVIPGLRHSERIARAAVEAGKDVLCHLPMEAEKESWDAGEIPLIRVAMKPAEIEKAIADALATVPGAVGMNNHMGSAATADRKVMEAVLRACRARGLFFLDSMTTPRSVVRETARGIGTSEAGNDLFLDHGEGTTRENMQKLLSIAARRGTAIGIIHVRKDTPAELRWMADEARREGIDFVTVRQIIARQAMTVAEGGTR